MLVFVLGQIIDFTRAHTKDFYNSLVLFCVPDLEMCDIARDALNRVEITSIPVFYFDCTKEALSCQQFAIIEFPFLVLIQGNKSGEFKGSFQPSTIQYYLDEFFARKDNKTGEKPPGMPKYIQDRNLADESAKYKRGGDKFYGYLDTDYQRDCLEDDRFNFETQFSGTAVKDLRLHDYLQLITKPVLFLVADASRNSHWLIKIVTEIDSRPELIEFYEKMAFSFVDINFFEYYVQTDFYIFKVPAVVILWHEAYWIIDPDPANLVAEVRNWWARYAKL